ncbi:MULTISPECIES: hypothetical protein [Streptomyces]|uniref:hypothetical protein n=1 Tax=Streptomyces TaxID=1883 RepID=UPI001F197A61|nr:hypothetical protein [Streptomyces indiaensis]MCF1648724.1 hypothetical protein [Streptomyces indiaensis]
MVTTGKRTRRGSAAVVMLSALAIAAAMAAPPAVAAGGTPARESLTVTRSAWSDPTPEEQEKLREVAGAIWSPTLAAGWNMNADVADILSTATGEILRCSEAFALVPRPPGFVPGLGYLVSYGKNLREYFLAVKNNRTYRACVVTAAANYRSPIEIASLGV